jgi:hypothetical protein
MTPEQKQERMAAIRAVARDFYARRAAMKAEAHDRLMRGQSARCLTVAIGQGPAIPYPDVHHGLDVAVAYHRGIGKRCPIYVAGI